MNYPKIIKILESQNENNDVKTFKFKYNENVSPGQFFMIWIPGVDEIPMSLSNCDNNGNWSITVKNVGECTDAMYNLNIGDYIGVRGPLGNHFKIPEKNIKNIILIGGGIGMAPLKFLSYHLIQANMKHTIIEGAKIEDDIIFKNYFCQTYRLR